MRQTIKLLAVPLSLALSSAASAQPQLVQRVGDRWVFAIPDSSLVSTSYIGQKVHFPITGARRIGIGVLIGEAAICYGRYSGKVPENSGSVEGRVLRLELSSARFKNTRGHTYRRATNIFALTDCKFGPVDLDTVPKTLAADEAARKAREDAELDAITQDFLRQDRENCLRILAERNIPADPQAIRTYCP